MKKLLILVLLLIPIKVFSISASSAIAMDLDNGRILYGYNLNNKRLIASITKIMTAIVAIENSDINKEIEVTDIIYESFGSGIYIEVGEKLTIKDLLYGLMLRSGNDAALMISEAVSGSEEEFVYKMNEYATNINMENTIFYNPHGLEENNGNANISTALDMAKLTRYAMQNKTFREIFGTKKYTVKTNYKTYVWHNKNKLLSEDYVTGGKTGFTKLARRTLVTTGTKDNVNLIVVTLNDPNDWLDHKSIYSNIFNNYKSYEIINKNKIKLEDNEYYKNSNLYIKNNYNMSLTKKELKKLTLNINLLKLDEFSDDQIVGYIEVILNKEIYHKEPIYVKHMKKDEKLTILQKLKRWLHKW
mgnify:CR=1 FL=1